MSHARTLALFAALLTFTATSGVSGSWVLCIGADGHISLEAEGARCCQTSPACGGGPRFEQASVGVGSEGCVPCTDIPLLIGASCPMITHTVPIGECVCGLFALPATFTTVFIEASLHRRVRCQPSSVSASPLSHRRTVVLRC